LVDEKESGFSAVREFEAEALSAGRGEDVRLEVGVFVEEEDGALAESELFMEGIEESLSQGLQGLPTGPREQPRAKALRRESLV
jgi:hypothetical protein